MIQNVSKDLHTDLFIPSSRFDNHVFEFYYFPLI